MEGLDQRCLLLGRGSRLANSHCQKLVFIHEVKCPQHKRMDANAPSQGLPGLALDLSVSCGRLLTASANTHAACGSCCSCMYPTASVLSRRVCGIHWLSFFMYRKNMSEIEKEESSKSSTMVGVIVNNNQENDDPDISALKSLFQISLEIRNFEINQLVQRNNFFMVFQGVLFAGVIQSSHTKPVVSFLVCLVGLIVSFYHVRMAAGAKFWQEYWEHALHSIENHLMKKLHTSDCKRTTTIQLFHEESHIYQDMVKSRLANHGFSLINGLILKRYSVSRVPIYVAIAITLIWLLLTLCTLRGYPPLSVPSFVVGF